MAADITVDGLNNWSYWQYCSNNPNYKFMSDTAGKRQVTVKIRSENKRVDSGRSLRCDMITADYTFYPNSTDAGTYSIKNNDYVMAVGGTISYPQWYQDYGPVTYTQGTLSASLCNNIFNPVRNNKAFNTALNTILGTNTSIGDTSALRRLQDKIILDSSTNTYYRINIISASEGKPIEVTSSTTGGQAALEALNNSMNHPSSASGTLQGAYTTFTASNSSTSYAVQLTNVGVSLYVDLNSDRAHLNDAPYDMFCIPFSDTIRLKHDSTIGFVCSKNIALSMATEIARDLGSGTVYDVQLLPYCPNRTLVVNSSSPSTVLNLTGVKYDLIKESTTNRPRSAVIWCTDSTFQVPISVESGIIEFKPTVYPPGIIQPEKYYTIPDNTVSYTARISISTTGSNNIELYKVNKVTNKIIDSDLYNTIEITTNSYLNISKNGSSPDIHLELQEYNYADYYFVFRLRNVDFTGQNLNVLANKVRITEDYSILKPGDDALSRKLANECDVLRLVSQNYSAIFEFSPAKSGGVDGFLADCTYKPWSPYIHILPKLKGLYGDNFVAIDDARGLICGGDMSLSQLSNA